ncbi:MAG: hypothetical protein EAZ91_09035 [Cytophagales bacterium]|nr:MAG: hypothetical protein EAZ91_09035 [Cytophagales bacterium]
MLPFGFSWGIKKKSVALRFFGVYLWWTFFRNVVDIWTSSEKSNNLLLFNFDLLVRFTLLGLMFYHTFQYPYEKRAVLVMIIGFAMLFGVDFVLSNPNLSDLHNHRLNRYSFVVEGVLMLLLVLRFFLYLVRELPVANLSHYPFFWICCGLLIAHAGTIFLTPFLHYFNVWNNPYNFKTMVKIEHWVEIIRNAAFTIAMFFARRSTN